jgi:mannose-6-phosphate isomerase-like protein (cupin superfamily)
VKRDKESSEHYVRGQNCSGWHLLKPDSLCVIQERMPPNTSEDLRYRQKAQQFFYILSGQATFELEGEIFEANPNEVLYVDANNKHKIKNDSNIDLYFLVISEPKAHGDRTNIQL